MQLFGEWLAPAASALGAGIVNAIAGGGTLLTFPVLLGVLPAVAANATSTVALLPGALSSAFAYRKDLQDARFWLLLLALPSLFGGVLGALFLTRLDPTYFTRLVPWLILAAAILLLTQPYITRFTAEHRPNPDAVNTGRKWLMYTAAVCAQFVVSIYGGYFGAGASILMLSTLAFLPLGNFHQMNAVKVVLNFMINGIAVAVFISAGQVSWNHAGVMAVLAIAGGFLGARFSKSIAPQKARVIAAVLGLALAAYYFY